MSKIPYDTYIVAKALFYQDERSTTPFEDQNEHVQEIWFDRAAAIVDFIERAEYTIIKTGMGQ